MFKLAVTHLDPDTHTEVKANYSGYLNNITRDALSQTRALQKLLVISRQAEVKFCGMWNLISHQTTQDLLVNSTALIGYVEGFTTAVADSSADSTMSSTFIYGISSQTKNTLF